MASRNQYTKYCIFYSDISINIINNYNTIINCTPLGTYPNINICPNIPYMKISNKYYLYDLVYNPKETLFLKIGKKKDPLLIMELICFIYKQIFLVKYGIKYFIHQFMKEYYIYNILIHITLL